MIRLRERMRNGAQDGWTADIRIRLPSGELYRERVRAQGSNKSAAQRWAVERETWLIRNGGPEKRGEEQEKKQAPTFNDFAPRFLQEAETNNKASTAYAKKMILENHLRPFFGEKRLDEITTADVERYKAETLDDGLSKKSVNNHMICLRRLLTLAVEWGELTAAPKFKALRLPLQDFEFLDFEEAERFLAAATAPWLAMLTTALKTGLRIGELRALKWSDVDLVSGRVVVRRTIWRGQEDSPKGGRAREVPLSEKAVEVLKAHRQLRHLKGGYVFAHEDGAVLAEADVLGVVADTCRRCGIAKELSWHGLRHTFASHLVMRGQPLKAVQELLGHASIEMTMRYAHLSPDVRRQAVQVLDAPAPVASVVARQEAQ